MPILTIELTFACVPAAEGDQSDDTDEQDTASTNCSTNNNQHGEGFCNQNKKDNSKEKCGVAGVSKSRTCRSEQKKRKKEIHSIVLLIPETSEPTRSHSR